MMKLITVSSTAAIMISNASAFAPANYKQSTTITSFSLNVASSNLNGWIPDETKFAYGLPGSLSPVPNFDPFGFAEKADLVQMKNYREAETTHGRVAMLAFIGFLVTEAPLKFHPLFDTGSKDIGPAIRHLDEVRAVTPFFFEILALVIGALELGRALKGWENPGEVYESGNVLKDDYFPGDIGFDPLGLKPEDPEEFAKMSTRELQHGRLAMLAVAGFFAQELVNGKEILVNLGLAPETFDPSSLPVQF